MKSQIVTLKVADALGDPITNATVVLNISKTVTQAFEYIEADEVYKATIRGDLTPADYTVTITKDKYTFAKAPATLFGLDLLLTFNVSIFISFLSFNYI